MKKKLFVIGIDVSKDKLDVYFYETGLHFIVSNDFKGFAKLTEMIMNNSKCNKKHILICFENTGKYSKQLSVYLAEQDIAFVMSPALAIKKSLGLVRGKDDKIDSKRIATYAYEKQDKLVPTKLPGYKIDQMKSLIQLREKLIRHRTAYKNGIKDLKDCYIEGETDFIRQIQKSMIEQLSERIDQIEDRLKSIINEDEAMKKNFSLLLSIQGIGKITAFFLITYTANFTLFNNWRSFACFCGTAPFPYSSGKMVGQSRVHKFANKKLKSLLDLISKSALRYGEFKSYYNRRIKLQGKNKMSTINIIRNKMIARAFAVVNRGTPFVDYYKFAA
jgi:transposase